MTQREDLMVDQIARALFLADNGEEYGALPVEQDIVPYKKMAKIASQIVTAHFAGEAGRIMGNPLGIKYEVPKSEPNLQSSHVYPASDDQDEVRDNASLRRILDAVWDHRYSTTNAIDELRPYLRQPVPVSVSLEKCANAASQFVSDAQLGSKLSPSRRMGKRLIYATEVAKAVLDAAGVKYEV